MKLAPVFILFFFLFSCSSERKRATNDSLATAITADSIPDKGLLTKEDFGPFKEEIADDPDNEKGFALMENEHVGVLHLEMKQEEVLAELGAPDHKSPAELWGADGLYHQDWTFDAAGIELNMSGKDSLHTDVFIIRFYSPCTLKTSRNIGIGSTVEEVKAAYAEEIRETEDEGSLVAGSIYGGVIFSFENRKLSSVFIGAAAE